MKDIENYFLKNLTIIKELVNNAMEKIRKRIRNHTLMISNIIHLFYRRDVKWNVTYVTYDAK